MIAFSEQPCFLLVAKINSFLMGVEASDFKLFSTFINPGDLYFFAVYFEPAGFVALLVVLP